MRQNSDSLILVNGTNSRFYRNKGGRTYTDSIVLEQLSVDIGVYGITVAVPHHDVHDVLLVDGSCLLGRALYLLHGELIAMIDQLLHLP